MDWLPLPGPVLYAIAAVASLVLFSLNDWLTLGRPLEVIQPFHIVLALGPVYSLALMHLLDVQARRALKRMRPLDRSAGGVRRACSNKSSPCRHA